jgi:3-oxoacyl-[acyl-carrier protein] reductase
VGKLDGRTALVTGGSSGIGRAVCLAFAAEGCDLAIVDMDRDRAAEIVTQAESMGRRAVAVRADVTDEHQVGNAVAESLLLLGTLDICVANAGIAGSERPLHELTLDQWRRLIDGDLTSVFLTLRAVLPHMIERRYGRIITTSSQLAHKPAVLYSAYCAAKAGVVAMTASVAQEVAHLGIRVNNVAPGPTRTPMNDREEIREWLAEKVKGLPIGRLAEPEEIAPAYVFLASQDAEYMVGQTISPNGGDVFW